MLVNEHSCTLTPSLVVLGLAPMTGATFSKAVVDVLEVIGGLAMPQLLFLQLVLLSKVKKVSSLEKSFVKGTVLELVSDTVKNTYRTFSLQNNWGTAAKPVLPYKSMGACDWQIVTF